MRKLLLIFGLFISLTLSAQSTHSFFFMFDTKAVALGKNTIFSNIQSCNSTLNLFDRMSCFLLNDPITGGVFDIKNVEKNSECNILVFTCVKRETKMDCMIILEDEFVTFIYATVAYRSHIRWSNEMN